MGGSRPISSQNKLLNDTSSKLVVQPFRLIDPIYLIPPEMNQFSNIAPKVTNIQIDSTKYGAVDIVSQNSNATTALIKPNNTQNGMSHREFSARKGLEINQ